MPTHLNRLFLSSKGMQSFTGDSADGVGVVEIGANCIIDSIIYGPKELYDPCLHACEAP